MKRMPINQRHSISVAANSIKFAIKPAATKNQCSIVFYRYIGSLHLTPSLDYLITASVVLIGFNRLRLTSCPPRSNQIFQL